MSETLTPAAEALWLDSLLDAEMRRDIEKQVNGAIDKDRTLRNLVMTTPILRGAINRAIMACLHFDPLALLADGWCAARDIRASRNAGKAVVLKLGAHSLSRDMQPAVTVDVGSEKRFVLDIGLGLIGAFDGVEVTISDSKLVSVGSGTCRLSLQIRVANRTVVSRDLQTLDLPGEYRFAQPLALR